MDILIIKLSPIEGLNSSMIRTLALTKGLLSQGHKVDFITIPISETHVTANEYDFIENVGLIRAQKNVAYENVVSRKNNQGSIKTSLIKLLRKTYHKFSLYNYTHSIAKNINISLLEKRYYDIVISTSDPKTSHIAMKQLINQGLKYKKWIQYWGDPMAIDITKKSIYPKWIVRNVEKNLLSNADKIIYVSPFTLKEQKEMFPSLASKMSFLPVPYISEKYYEKTKNEKFTIGYFGAYPSKVRNIMPLYAAGVKMQENIKLNIVGDSDISLQPTNNISIYPRGDISNFEKNADLLVCMLNSSGTQIPGKIYHYASTNKPILVLVDGEKKEEMKKYLESYNRYIICENKEENIMIAIKKIMDNNEECEPCISFNSELIAKAFIS